MTPRTRIDQTLALAALAIIVVGCWLVLRPFLTAILWAVILAVTAWPLQLWLRQRMGPLASSSLVVLLITLVVLAPFVVVATEIADNSQRVAAWFRQWSTDGPPDPPAWIARLPVVGERLAAYLATFAHDTVRLVAELKRFAEPVRNFLVTTGTTLAGGLVQLAMSIVIAFFLLRDGEAIVRRLDVAGLRLAGTRGQRLAVAASRTVRGVVVGILGTAVAQGVLAGFGFWLAGVQAAPLLGFTTFLLSPVPIGPPLVWGTVGLALLGQGATGWGVFVLLWGMLVVSMIDNVIKPLLISQGSDLPFVLVLIGVLGGVVAFGFIGVFLGPVLLAIGYSLARDWSAEEALARMQASGPDADAATTVSPEVLPRAQPPAS